MTYGQALNKNNGKYIRFNVKRYKLRLDNQAAKTDISRWILN